MTEPLTTEQIDEAREAVQDLLEAVETFRQALPSAVYHALRYGEHAAGRDRAPYECRNLIADVEGKDHGWLGDGMTIDALRAALVWLEDEAQDADMCTWCGEPANGTDGDDELGPLGCGPDGTMHDGCWSAAREYEARRAQREGARS